MRTQRKPTEGPAFPRMRFGVCARNTSAARLQCRRGQCLLRATRSSPAGDRPCLRLPPLAASSHPEQLRGRPSLPPASLLRRVASPHGSARARVPRLRAERGAPPVPRQSAEGPWSELPPVGTPGAEARPVQQLLRVHFKRRVQHTRHLCVREVGDEKPAPRPCVGERADEGELTIPARLCHVKTASNSTRWSSQFLSVGQIFRNGLAGRFWPGAYPGASAKVSARAAGT